MGVVAKCVHLGLDKYVAIKMLRQDVMLDQDAKERFLREAQAASKLRSEHVAKVEDVGHFPETGVPYMVMEFLDGHDLGDLVDERGAIAAPFASMLMLQAAEALAEAHSIGIVHRDVKPSNLFVTWRPDGSAIVKVLDFGISKAPTGTDMKLTQTQSLLGTPAYMSPEQMRSARLVDARTDIWSFGTVFYELLEGRRPFEAESFSEMCVKVAVDPPSPMVNTPPALQPIIMRCLAKNPDQRYASMAELGRDLLPHVQDVHQASLLVERMQRVLGRRSAAHGGDWESPTTGITRTPSVVSDAASAPIAIPWHGGSDAVGVAVPTPFGAERTPDPRTPITTLRDPMPRPATGVERPKSKKLLVVMGSVVVIGIAIGLVYGLRGDGGEDTPHVTAPPKVDPPTEPRAPDRPAVDPARDPKDAKDVAAKPTADVKQEGSAGKELDPPDGKKPGAGSAAKPPVVKPLVKKPPVIGKPPLVKKPPPEKKEPPPPEVKKPAGNPCPIEDRLPGGGCYSKK
jgi:serine/threonine-protein kinase